MSSDIDNARILLSLVKLNRLRHIYIILEKVIALNVSFKTYTVFGS